MKRVALAAALLLALGAVTAIAGTTTPRITQASIAHAKVGLSPSTYKSLLGASGVKEQLNAPEGWSRLVFVTRKVAVYFDDEGKAAIVTTWNKSYKTAAGIGPCSTISKLKKVYGKRLKPSKFNTQAGVVYAYTVGKNLIFASNGHRTVESIGLYDGSNPNVEKQGGTRAFAGFVTLNESACV